MSARLGGALAHRQAAAIARASIALLSIVSTNACGGGLPLLHPAQALGPGEVRAATGFSGNITLPGLSTATQRAIDEAAAGDTPGAGGSDSAYTKGALAAASIGSGLAPFVTARVGLGAQTEAGIGYTGRATRADIRHAFTLSDAWALSAGIGGSAVLYGRQDGDALPYVDLGDLHGEGADVPVIVGYRSAAGLYMVWAGARAGWEHVAISALTSQPGAPAFGGPPIALSATRLWAGGLVGAAAGFRHLHVAMELDVSFADVWGQYDATQGRVDGLTLAPSTAVWWDF